MRSPRHAARALAFALLAAPGAQVAAAPLAETEIARICEAAEDESHCGRLIEEIQLKRLPGLARRSGNTLTVSLFPSGSAAFVDSDDVVAGRSYSLWDSLDSINTVVLFTTQGDRTSYLLLQRTTNRRVDVPTEPVVSPDRERIATADFCGPDCGNELAVWRVARDGIRKELAWSPREVWGAAAVSWKDVDTLLVEYVAGGVPQKLERKLADPSWRRVPAP